MIILIVDDHADIAELFRARIEDLGHACLKAETVDGARTIVAGIAVDAMALDLGLPGADPLEWLETLATESPRLAYRTVVITGRDLDREERIRIEACGASILLKPFGIGPLLDRLLHDRERPLRPVSGESWPAVREPRPKRDAER